MNKLLTNNQMRAADAYTISAGVSSERLMKRAGIALAEEVALVAGGIEAKSILVVCGTGNNGGDGYVCAEELKRRGLNVSVYAAEGRLSFDCAREKSAYSGAYTEIVAGDIVVDCIFGTGLARDVSGVYAEIIDKINASGAYIISADIPSGLNGDNGRTMGTAVKADLTVTIAEYKAGLFLADGLDKCGAVVKKDIGIICPDGDYVYAVEDADVKPFYPRRLRNCHKGTYGRANIVAGSENYIGAAALSVSAALKSGCGYVVLTAPEQVRYALAAALPQAVYTALCDSSANAVAIGMGCGVSEALFGEIKSLLKAYDGTLIIDADGLNSLSKFGTEALRGHSCNVILTPHVKEFSRLTGLNTEDILSDPVGLGRAFAEKYGVTLVLKGASTVITDGKRTAVSASGSSAQAKAGSGDMLSGFMCGCAARGLQPFDAAVCAVYTLGLAAEAAAEKYTEYCTTSEEVLNNLHFAIKRLTE